MAERRLTALWAFSESGLGGLFHLFKLPFTGILLGGFGLICISLYGRQNQFDTRRLFGAWASVLGIKLALSPQSPPTAYLAVSFQTWCYWLFQRLIPHFRTASTLSGALSLAESAVQRVLVLTLFLGVGLWEAIDRFSHKLLISWGLSGEFSGSQFLIGAYVGGYSLLGAALGYWAGDLPKHIMRLQADMPEKSMIIPPEKPIAFIKRNKSKPPTLFPWVLMLCGAVVFGAGAQQPAYLLMRGGALWLIWLLIQASGWYRRWVSRIISPAGEAEINDIASEWPAFDTLIRDAWRLSALHQNSQWRPSRFLSWTFALILPRYAFESDKKT